MITVQVKGFSRDWVVANQERILRAVHRAPGGSLEAVRVHSVVNEQGDAVELYVTCLLTVRPDGVRELAPAGLADEAVLLRLGIAA